ncbi:MAG: hypothetical protein E7273_09705 [Pseudobutyrivibrio ruminis]|nr:hypothetical protein [Pseudobutyrivibrio ruminis]
MSFLSGFNRALIGFPLKEFSNLDGVSAVNAAMTAEMKAKKAADAAQSAVMRKLMGLKNGISASAIQDELVFDTALTYYWLEVEFNPNSLRYVARNGSIQQQHSVTGDIGANIAQYNVEAQTDLHFDMFIDSAVCLSATTGVNLSTAVSGAVNIFKGQDYYNIAPIVDGLCSLCNSVETQYLIFAWGRMVFYGVLESVDAEYQMFDVDGKPIRAKVNISIRQCGKLGKDEKVDVFSKSNSYWKDVYNSFFGKGSQMNLRFGRGSSKSENVEGIKDFNNLLNLK